MTAKKPVPQDSSEPGPQESSTLIALFADGRYTEAANLAQAMTVRYPRHGLGWKALGALLWQMGRIADALAPLQKAAVLLPDDEEVHNNLGNTLKNLGQLDDAEETYRRAVQINPDYANAHYNLGNTLLDLDRPDEAQASSAGRCKSSQILPRPSATWAMLFLI